MTPDERLQLTRTIPPDLKPEEVVIRHGNALREPTADCWYVTVRGKLVPGHYPPDQAARLRAQILRVSEVRAAFDLIESWSIPTSSWCPFCGALWAKGVCAACVEAYQLHAPVQAPEPAA
jgi:hypothetical protein